MKTEASHKPVPMDGALAAGLLEWSGQTPYSQPGDWVFASPKMHGKQPYWPETLLKCYVLPIAKRLSITKKIGWHTLCRTQATLLTGSDENAKTTQELMRHANAGITMNLCAQALTSAKRAAHLKVVEMIRPARGTASVPLCSRTQKGKSVSA
jgi:integrase